MEHSNLSRRNLMKWGIATTLIPSTFRLRYRQSPATTLLLEEMISANALCTTTSGSATVTMTSTAGRAVGEAVTGAGIPAGTHILAVVNGTTLTLTANATATGTLVNLKFTRGDWVTRGSIVTAAANSWTLRLLYNILNNGVQGISSAATVACGTTSGSATVTMASTAGRSIGETVVGPGVLIGEVIQSISSSTNIVISVAATGTATGANLTFTRDGSVKLEHSSSSTAAITSGSATVTMASTLERAVGEAVSGTGIPTGTTIASISSGTQLTLSANATATNASASLAFAFTHVAKLERQKSGGGLDAGKGGVTVPKGKWQVRIVVASGQTIFDYAQVRLQKWNPTSGWGEIALWTKTHLIPGKTLIYNGQNSGALAADTLVRVLYAHGSVMLPRMLGEAVIETVVYPESKAITLQVDVVNGTGRKMLARNSDGEPVSLFKPGHVGSFWQIAHRRELSHSELVGAVGAFAGASTEIRVFGHWDIFTYGTWWGTLQLERKTPWDAWEIIRSWKANGDRNVTASGVEEQDVDMRLRMVGGFGAAASGAAVPRFILEAADSRTYGLVKMVGYTSESEVTVDVARVLASTNPTGIWAEGAWSDVRGFPAAVGLHEGRLWFGGSAYQPQTLWASVSSDFENFRRSTLDDGGMALTLAAESSNSIRWLSSTSALLIGTGGEEWALRGGDGAPITPTNVRVERQSGYSSMPLGAKMVHEVTIFVQRDGRRLRQLSFTAELYRGGSHGAGAACDGGRCATTGVPTGADGDPVGGDEGRQALRHDLRTRAECLRLAPSRDRRRDRIGGRAAWHAGG